MKRIQSGVYYRNDYFNTSPKSRNHCFAMIFLRIANNVTSSQFAEYFKGLWKMYLNLKKGIICDLPGEKVPSGDLSVLVGYGPNIFMIPGVTRKIPRDFRERQFREAVSGKPILPGAGICYSCDSPSNVGISNHIAIQFVSSSQLASYRAVVETWKYITRIEPPLLKLSTFFTGFQRDDGRSWLGFHDEISNMKNETERRRAIIIDRFKNHLLPQDDWTSGGSYLAFLRLEINLPVWEKNERKNQEILIGRDKLTGIPIVGIDKKGNPLKKSGCIPSSKIRSYDIRFHDHPNYFHKPSVNHTLEPQLDVDSSIRLLSQSHIGRTRHIDGIKSDDPASRRIFRQGFEFIESTTNNPTKPLKVGLNFVSFQNDPARLLFILTDPNWLGRSNFGGTGGGKEMNDFLTAQASGIFFVPPTERPFPGVTMFN